MLTAVLYHIYNHYASEPDAYFKTASIVSLSQSFLLVSIYIAVGDSLINQGNGWLIFYVRLWWVLFMGLTMIYLIICYLLRGNVRDAFESYADYKFHQNAHKVGAFAYVVFSASTFFIYSFGVRYNQYHGSTYYSVLF